LHYAPEVVTLQGTLRKETVTEHASADDGADVPMRRAPIYVLELDAPIRVLADPESPRNYATFVNEARVQLSLDNNDSELMALVPAMKDNRVSAQGSLLQGDSPHHHTDVILRLADSSAVTRGKP